MLQEAKEKCFITKEKNLSLIENLLCIYEYEMKNKEKQNEL